MVTRNIDIDRYDTITSSHYRIRIVIVATAVGTASHGDDPLGRGHLIVDFSQRGRHLVGQRASYDDAIGLTRTSTKHDSVAIHIVTRRSDLHHFDGTTRQTERQWPKRTLIFFVEKKLKNLRLSNT